MAEEQRVKIESWPATPAELLHEFNESSPLPVRIIFEDAPARVIISGDSEGPLDVNMQMGLSVKEAIPVCIKLCEPICAQSDYRIGIDIFDRPVASIAVKGLTRLFNCREIPSQRECVDFKSFPVGETFTVSVRVSEVTFAALRGELRTVSYGDPAGQTKLGFPVEGVSIQLPAASKEVSVIVANYGNPALDVDAFRGGAAVENQRVSIQNSTQRITLRSSDITEIRILGGSNEASIVEVCYTLLGRGG